MTKVVLEQCFHARLRASFISKTRRLRVAMPYYPAYSATYAGIPAVFEDQHRSNRTSQDETIRAKARRAEAL